jgi:hypothetical protein
MLLESNIWRFPKRDFPQYSWLGITALDFKKKKKIFCYRLEKYQLATGLTSMVTKNIEKNADPVHMWIFASK